MRTSDLLKWKTNTETEHVGKGVDWETVYQSCDPKSWMRWVKLNCLKSSGKLETRSSLDTTVKSQDLAAATRGSQAAKSSCREQWSMRPIKPRKDTLSHPDNVNHDCTAGSPTGREP